MRQNLTVIDGFLADPQAVRDFALEHDFSGANQMDGHSYPGTAKPKHPQFHAWVEQQLSLAIGLPVKANTIAFVSSKEGEFTEQWIHADSNCARWAAVCYLFEGHHEHGTAFWRHRETQTSEMTQPFYDALKIDLKDEKQVEALVERVKAEANDEQFWEKADFTEARFGRLIWFNSKLWHSRYPRHAFGDSVETSRLIMVAFFDTP